MESNFVTLVDGTNLHYLEAGSGDPLVMVPGWSQTAAEFKYQIEAFSQFARVIALDMRGHGESDKPESGYRIQRLAKDLSEVLNALSLTKPNILGHSMGCSVIWSYTSMFANEQPLGKLVLVDQAPAIVALSNWDEQTRADAGCLLPDFEALVAFEDAVLGSADVATTKEVIRGLFSEGVDDALLQWAAEENHKLPRKYAAHLLHDHCVLDWRSQIKQITNPTLVIGGEASAIAASSQRWIANTIPGARAEICPADEKGSHFAFLENPDWFNNQVGPFLTE